MLAAAYLVLIFLIVLIEIFRKKVDAFDFFTLFNIYYFLLYPLPAFVLAFDFKNSASGLAARILPYTNSPQTALAIFVGYFLVLIGFSSNSAKILGERINFKEKGNNSNFIAFTIFLLFLSCVSIYIYSLQYGGIVDAIAKSSMIRARAVEGGSFVFFARLTMYSGLSSYLLYSFIFLRKTKNFHPFILTSFVFSVIATLTALTMSGARAGFVYYFISYYYAYMIKYKKISVGVIILLLLLIIPFIFYGKLIFFSLSAIPNGDYNDVLNIIEKGAENDEFSFYTFLHSFQHTVFSLDTALSANYQPRFFVDFFYGFLSIIPDRITGTEEVKTIPDYNAQYITGAMDYSIPPGLLAFGVYSMWWPGLILVCLAFGWIGRYLQTVLRKHVNNIFWMPVVYILVAQMWVDFINADPTTFIHANFCYWTGCLFLLMIASKVKVAR